MPCRGGDCVTAESGPPAKPTAWTLRLAVYEALSLVFCLVFCLAFCLVFCLAFCLGLPPAGCGGGRAPVALVQAARLPGLGGDGKA
jgi:hypothetical protein